MIIGLLSDTHGHIERTQRAMQLLLDEPVEAIIHCGDIGSEAVLFEMATLLHPHEVPAWAVLGNVDLGDPRLLHFPEESGITVRRRLDIELHGTSCAVLHGDDHRSLSGAISGGTYDYLFTGHTHTAADDAHGTCRVINPGAVYRASTPSVAVLDLETGSLKLVPLD